MKYAFIVYYYIVKGVIITKAIAQYSIVYYYLILFLIDPFVA